MQTDGSALPVKDIVEQATSRLFTTIKYSSQCQLVTILLPSAATAMHTIEPCWIYTLLTPFYTHGPRVVLMRQRIPRILPSDDIAFLRSLVRCYRTYGLGRYEGSLFPSVAFLYYTILLKFV